MTGQHFTLFDTTIGRCGIAWGPKGINAVQLPMGSEDKTRAASASAMAISRRRRRQPTCKARSTGSWNCSRASRTI